LNSRQPKAGLGYSTIYTIRALKDRLLSMPIQIQIQIIYMQHQLKQRCTTPHNLTKNISKLVLRNLNGLGSYLKANTGLVKTTTSDCLYIYQWQVCCKLKVTFFKFYNVFYMYNNSWVTAKLSNFVFCLDSIVDLCHYRFSEMDHKICYFLGRLTTNNFQLQGGGGGLRPPDPPPGALHAPGPRWGTAPRPTL